MCGQVLGRQTAHGQYMSEEQRVVAGPMGTGRHPCRQELQPVMVTVNQVLLLRKVFFHKVALGGPFIPTDFGEHGLRLQDASLLVFVQLRINNTVPSFSGTGQALSKFYLAVLLHSNLLPAAAFSSFFFFQPDT